MKLSEVCDSKKFGDCSTCGAHCCKEVKFIDITETDIERISKYLKISAKRFKQRYTHHNHLWKHATGTTKRSLKTPCFFLKNNRCSIYPVRPEVCETFPFRYFGNRTVIAGVGGTGFCPIATNFFKSLFEYSKQNYPELTPEEMPNPPEGMTTFPMPSTCIVESYLMEEIK